MGHWTALKMRPTKLIKGFFKHRTVTKEMMTLHIKVRTQYSGETRGFISTWDICILYKKESGNSTKNLLPKIYRRKYILNIVTYNTEKIFNLAADIWKRRLKFYGQEKMPKGNINSYSRYWLQGLRSGQFCQNRKVQKDQDKINRRKKESPVGENV